MTSAWTRRCSAQIKSHGMTWPSGACSRRSRTTYDEACGSGFPVPHALVRQSLSLPLRRRNLPRRRLQFRLATERDLRHLYELLDRGRRAAHVQLLHQEREPLLERLAERRFRALVHRPELRLERADRLLACLVEELLLGVVRFLLFECVLLEPRVHLGL